MHRSPTDGPVFIALATISQIADWAYQVNEMMKSAVIYLSQYTRVNPVDQLNCSKINSTYLPGTIIYSVKK